MSKRCRLTRCGPDPRACCLCTRAVECTDEACTMCMRDAIYSSGGAVILTYDGASLAAILCARVRVPVVRLFRWIEWGRCQNFYGNRVSVENTGNMVAVRDAISAVRSREVAPRPTDTSQRRQARRRRMHAPPDSCVLSLTKRYTTYYDSRRLYSTLYSLSLAARTRGVGPAHAASVEETLTSASLP